METGPALTDEETLIEKIVDEIRAEQSTLKCIKILERFKKGDPDQDKMTFTYGFTFKEVIYGWNDKKLYRLPFERKDRVYGMKEVKPFKDRAVYNIQREQKTIAHLRLLTVKFLVAKEVSIIESNNDVP